MDRLCVERQKNGFPAKSIQWGLIGQVSVLLVQMCLRVFIHFLVLLFHLYDGYGKVG